MKYILILKICSVLAKDCTSEIHNTLTFNSWIECANAGYLRAIEINNTLGSEFVNGNKVIINFKCESIEQV
tara:strand:- start:207 stop:419 length:213 start_codon:yes stop_codon:yes gene_type:complete